VAQVVGLVDEHALKSFGPLVAELKNLLVPASGDATALIATRFFDPPAATMTPAAHIVTVTVPFPGAASSISQLHTPGSRIEQLAYARIPGPALSQALSKQARFTRVVPRSVAATVPLPSLPVSLDVFRIRMVS